MAVFRFKRFDVQHHQSTMKVGTDAMLVGALTGINPEHQRILDAGAGCGIIALMIAQRSDATVDAIDIDEQSVAEADINFKNSPWANRLSVFNDSLQHFSKNNPGKYDLIVSNPPFFQNSLLPANNRLGIAKHNQMLNFRDFLQCAYRLLNNTGEISLILPIKESAPFLHFAKAGNFALKQLCDIIPIEGKPANRRLLHLSKESGDEIQKSTITLRTSSGKFADEYKQITKDYHPDIYFD
jgi:tRNA1Val (adenine37-N6)-methyltransferase